jgi:hypothetical protein
VSDFLTRLAQRAVGQAPLLEPLVRPRGAAETVDVQRADTHTAMGGSVASGTATDAWRAEMTQSETDVGAEARGSVMDASHDGVMQSDPGFDHAARGSVTAGASDDQMTEPVSEGAAAVPGARVAEHGERDSAAERARAEARVSARAAKDSYATLAIEGTPTGDSLLLFSDESAPYRSALEPRRERALAMAARDEDAGALRAREGMSPGDGLLLFSEGPMSSPRAWEARHERASAMAAREEDANGRGDDAHVARASRDDDAALAGEGVAAGDGLLLFSEEALPSLGALEDGRQMASATGGQFGSDSNFDVDSQSGVSVSIGRVVVRPSTPPPPAPVRRAATPARDPRMTLAEYLASRNRR